MHQAMQALKAEGVQRVSLCLIPGLRCQRAASRRQPAGAAGIVLGTQHFGVLFDTAGAYHFKTRFRPRFESRDPASGPR